MQIHELTKKKLDEASIADTIKSAGTAVAQAVKNPQQTVQQAKQAYQGFNDRMAAANVARGTAQQQKTQAQAAKYAQALQRQGYGTAATASATQPATQPAQQSMILGPDGQPLTTPAQPAASVATTQPAGAVNTNRLQAQAVATGQAGAVMTTPDFNAAIRQLNLTPTHIDSLKDGFAKNASFATAFLKATGLKK